MCVRTQDVVPRACMQPGGAHILVSPSTLSQRPRRPTIAVPGARGMWVQRLVARLPSAVVNLAVVFMHGASPPHGWSAGHARACGCSVCVVVALMVLAGRMMRHPTKCQGYELFSRWAGPPC